MLIHNSTCKLASSLVLSAAVLGGASVHAGTSLAEQKAMTPQAAFERLLAGNQRFTSGVAVNRDLTAEVSVSSEGQYPFGVVLSCLDSRTAPELIFDQGVGDLFVGRIAGNFANEDMIGSFEFAHKLAGAKILVVIGHTACGAVKGAADGARMGLLTTTLEKLEPAISKVPASVSPRNSKNPAFVQAIADANVRHTVDQILARSEVLSSMVAKGEIGVIGGMYDLATGQVTFFPDTARNIKLAESAGG